jgi:lysophospholipase L1-like esterase
LDDRESFASTVSPALISYGCLQTGDQGYNRGQPLRVKYRSKSVIKRSVSLTSWTIASTALSGLVFLALLNRASLTALFESRFPLRSEAMAQPSPYPEPSPAAPSPVAQLSPYPEPAVSPTPAASGDRVYLSYDQWVSLLGREAKVIAEDRPPRLTILAGDSLSLWFPQELLPTGYTWLNQGISGDASYGLLRRLKLFDATDPETVFVMIGINDLSQGLRRETVLANYREIIHALKAAHPHARIVVQSILPHAADRALQTRNPPPWAPRLINTPNATIRALNQQLAIAAKEENVDYLDLHSAFTDRQGEMQAALTTDGLHLNRRGYEVWQARLQSFQQRSPYPTSVLSP